MFVNQSLNLVQFRTAESSASFQSHWIQPELGLRVVTFHVDVTRLLPIPE